MSELLHTVQCGTATDLGWSLWRWGKAKIYPSGGRSSADFYAMASQDPSECICREIAAELRDMASWLLSGRLSPEQFRLAVMTLEAAKLQRFGFTLLGENGENGRTHFELRSAQDDRLCATLDYDSGSRELEVHHLHG